MRVLVTGGAGFIGSHTVVALIEAGHEPVIVDNLSNARSSVLGRIEQITGQLPVFHQLDIRDRSALDEILASGFDACMHLAALKSVGESVEQPLLYYDNNVAGTVTLLESLVDTATRVLIFSSSATVYGDPERLPVTEDMPPGAAVNPYGWTKIMMEQVLRDVHRADPRWSIGLLRYFNPVGGHSSGLIGEDPQGTPSNLMPYIARVAAGLLPRLRVFGGDYPTPDGTGIRDYVHVMDVAEGHVAALDRLAAEPGVHAYNLGTGQGHSVLQVVEEYEKASGRAVPYDIVGRRPGDVAASWANVDKAASDLGWRAKRDLTQMCSDSWAWQTKSR
jgi:UDP-glucose 4-epimerase